MALKGKPISIGTTDTTIYTCPATTEASVHGLVFANNTGSAVTITVKVYIQSLATTTTVATGISVAANSTYTWPKPVDVNAGDYISALASTGSAIVCLYSVYEGTATPVAVGFTPRGAWSSGSTYAANDVVSYSNSSYLAIQATTNNQPDTSTAYWMLLAAQGATGSGDVTGPVSSVDSELALFSSTTGKVIKRASLSGLVKATSGVASAATAGTDYVAPGGALGTPSSGTLTNATGLPISTGVSGLGTGVATAAAAAVNGSAGFITYATYAPASGKTLTVSNSITLAGTDSTTMTFPGVSASVGYLNIPQVGGAAKTASYTAVLADSGNMIVMNGATLTATIPANSSVAFPVGTVLTFVNTYAGSLSIAITTDTMTLVNSTTTGTRTLAQNGVATAIKVSSTSWIISGAGLT